MIKRSRTSYLIYGKLLLQIVKSRHWNEKEAVRIMRTCKNCEGAVVLINDHIGKCKYCGSFYSINQNSQVASDIELVYREGCSLLTSSSEEERNDGIRLLEELRGYKDSDDRVANYLAFQERIRRNKALDDIRKKENYEKSRKSTMALIIVGSIVMGCLMILSMGFYVYYLYLRPYFRSVERSSSASIYDADDYDYDEDEDDGYWIYEGESGYDHDIDSETSLPKPDRVPLSTLTPYTYVSPFDSLPYGEHHDVEDIFGNSHSVVFRPYYEVSNGESKVKYRLDSEYTRFEFTLAIWSVERGNPGKGCLKIYSDDKLLFERNDITSDSETEHIELDITGCKDLIIEFYKGEKNFSSVSPMMCDPELYR